MEKTVTLEEALKRIEELEKENAELREELEYYRNRKLSGRQKHNAKWMAIYNDFVIGYGKRGSNLCAAAESDCNRDWEGRTGSRGAASDSPSACTGCRSERDDSQ